jgi:hypothetical protein
MAQAHFYFFVLPRIFMLTRRSIHRMLIMSMQEHGANQKDRSMKDEKPTPVVEDFDFRFWKPMTHLNYVESFAELYMHHEPDMPQPYTVSEWFGTGNCRLTTMGLWRDMDEDPGIAVFKPMLTILYTFDERGNKIQSVCFRNTKYEVGTV